MAHSKDGTRIETARRGGNVITVIDPLSDAPQQNINTAMRIRNVGIAGNTVFTADVHARSLGKIEVEVGVVHRPLCMAAVEIEAMCIDPNPGEHLQYPPVIPGLPSPSMGSFSCTAFEISWFSTSIRWTATSWLSGSLLTDVSYISSLTQTFSRQSIPEAV